MKCGQVAILSRAKNMVGVKASGAVGAASALSQVLRLDQPEAGATFVGPLRLYLSHVKHVAMQSLKDAAVNRPVEVEAWRREVFIPAGHQYRVNYADLVGQHADGCVVVTGGEVDVDEPPQTQAGDDLPCDFAVSPIKGTQYIFPPSCEPCESGVVHAPPVCGPSIPIPVAAGGCVRPRFFNGMFITREDLETQLRYLRVKQRLQNRAMGEGVVWGLPLFLDGTRVRVGPGYAVDCCGNDLTVTCDYSVSVEALLSDPRLCGKLGELKCAKLVLQYVECQEQPRPVHGEACGQATPGCEMSRVRETVRLRLQPICDGDDGHKDPIEAAFERLLAILRPQPAGQGQPTSQPTTAGQPVWTRATTGTVQVPWKAVAQGQPLGQLIVPPRQLPATTVPPPQVRWVPLLRDQGDTLTIAFEAVQAVFDGIDVRQGGAALAPAPVQTPTRLEFKYRVPDNDAPAQFDATWAIVDPPMRSPRSPAEPAVLSIARQVGRQYDNRETLIIDPNTADVRFPLNTADLPVVGQFISMRSVEQPPTTLVGEVTGITDEPNRRTVRARLLTSAGNFPAQSRPVIARLPHARVELRPVAVEVPVPPAPPAVLPCCDDPCCGHAQGLDPDDRLLVLMLVLYYAKILQELAALKREQETPAGVPGAPAGGTPASLAALSDAAKNLLRALLPASSQNLPSRLDELDEAMRAFYTLWCCRALYGGPTCGCGCGGGGDGGCGCGSGGGGAGEHGVVIGCAYFRAGQICRVSPLDGRRWVLHPPLLQHWASAFGFPALDEAVMGLFARLCCVRALPPLTDYLPPTRVDVRPVPTLTDTSPRLRFGGVAAGAGGAASLGALRDALPHGFVAAINPLSAVAAAPGVAQDCATSFRASLLRAIVAVETLSAGALVENVSRFLCHPLCGAARQAVDPQLDARRAISRLAVASVPPPAREAPQPQPLLREAADELAASIVARATLAGLSAAEPVRDDLERGGMRTVADVLARPPRDLGRLVNPERLRDVNAAYLEAERFPAAVAAGVGAAFVRLDKEGTTTPRDWTEPDARAKLERELARALTAGTGRDRRRPLVDEEGLRAALDEWAGETREREGDR